MSRAHNLYKACRGSTTLQTARTPHCRFASQKPANKPNDPETPPDAALAPAAPPRPGLWATYRSEYRRAAAKSEADTQRGALFREAFERGYFDDAKVLLRSGLKMGAPQVGAPTPPETSPVLPDLAPVHALDNRADLPSSLAAWLTGPTLVAFFRSRLGEQQVRPWLDWVDQERARGALPADLAVWRLSVEENRAKGAIQRLFLPLLRWQTLPEQRQRYLRYTRALPAGFAAVCGMPNQYLGYILVIDASRRIRWVANGSPTPDELAALSRALCATYHEATSAGSSKRQSQGRQSR